MTRQRKIIAIVALLGLAGIWPAAASANPLLSGYGGPGQGNQAILGSALLNGPGRGGGSGGPPAAATSGGSQGAQLSVPGGTSGSTHAAAPAGSSAKRHSATSPAGSSRQAPTVAGSAAGVYAALERGAARPSAFLGLSGDDLLYILLGLGVLAFTGVATSRFARRGGAGEHAG
jgi:hypothetical protein